MFGHLKPKTKVSTVFDVGTVTMTWEKFARTALPGAEKIELMVPAAGSFTALVTAVDPDAPPILQWDREGRRNPVSWYVYAGGSMARRWNLSEMWTEVTTITKLPPAWDDSHTYANQGEGAVLILRGARDTAHVAGGGLFTECLRSEYHSIRRTLEAHVLRAPIAGRDEASACGYGLRKGGEMSALVRVTVGDLRTSYRIDRWD